MSEETYVCRLIEELSAHFMESPAGQGDVVKVSGAGKLAVCMHDQHNK